MLEVVRGSPNLGATWTFPTDRSAEVPRRTAALLRAYALAVLAWEELSKAELCLMPLLLPEITPEDFWQRFRDHEGKLGRVYAFAAFMQAGPVGPVTEYVKKVMGLSRSTAKQKERGWYVDYRRGKILLPSQIGEMAARRQIKVVRDALVPCRSCILC